MFVASFCHPVRKLTNIRPSCFVDFWDFVISQIDFLFLKVKIPKENKIYEEIYVLFWAEITARCPLHRISIDFRTNLARNRLRQFPSPKISFDLQEIVKWEAATNISNA